MHDNERKPIEDFVIEVKNNFKVECELLFTEKELKKEKLDLAVVLG